jgi:hypothetical protein
MFYLLFGAIYQTMYVSVILCISNLIMYYNPQDMDEKKSLVTFF